MKFTRVFTLSLLLVFTLSLGFSAVSAQDNDNVLVIGWEQEPPILSPLSDLTFSALLQSFYARDVWNWDVDREIFPEMVAEIPTFENGLVETLESGNTRVTYKLREGLKWSDGEAITSADCAFWHELQIDSTKATFQRTSYPDVVEAFDVVDDLTFQLTYNSPFPDYLISATATCAYPEHVLRPVLDAEGTIDKAPLFMGQGVVGYGPYVLSSWEIGESITFTANPHWDGAQPAFGTVIVRFVTDSAQMVNALRNGEIDVAFNWSDTLVDSYSEISDVEVFSTAGVYGDAIWFNFGNGGHPALTDVNVRKALIHAIDRATLATELVGEGVGVPASWFPGQFVPEDVVPLEYDVELAKSLLDEAGWVDSNGDGIREKDGVALILRFFTTTAQLRMDYQIAIQQYWTEVGVSTQLIPVPATILFAGFPQRGVMATGDFDASLFALSSEPLTPFADASSWFGCGNTPSSDDPNGNNFWGSCDEEFDRLQLETGRTVDAEERLAIAQDSIRHFYNLQFWHGLYLRPTWYAINTTVVDSDSAKDVGTLSSNYFNKIELWKPAGS